jgi:hypothetical protein
VTGPILLLLLAAPSALAFDLKGVALGAPEAEVRKAFPAARCKPLEWKRDAAERRCDDARSALAGAEVRVTFYLKGDAVQAFSVRFDSKDLERVAAQLRVPVRGASRRGDRGDRAPRARGPARLQDALGEGAARAVLSAQLNRKRAELEAWRGDFDTEIYRVR